MLDWEWYDDINAKVLFIHCLLKANWKDNEWRGNKIKRGSFITSLPSLSKETGLSLQQTRTSLDKLKLTGELTDKPTNKNRYITVTNYDRFQDVNRQTNRQVTDKQQTNNRQVTATKENKQNKESKQINIMADFNKFWNCYNIKMKKPEALKAFRKAIKKTSLENMLNGIERYDKSLGADKTYKNFPKTWLDQERWSDDYQSPKEVANDELKPTYSATMYNAALDRLKRSNGSYYDKMLTDQAYVKAFETEQLRRAKIS